MSVVARYVQKDTDICPSAFGYLPFSSYLLDVLRTIYHIIYPLHEENMVISVKGHERFNVDLQELWGDDARCYFHIRQECN